MKTLYYVHDPMCSWCWGFRPVWDAVLKQLPADVKVSRLLGGLAPDCDTPMPEQMQRYLQQTWQRIQQVVPDTRFNFDFWRDCQPRRSTYPACRAVIAARAQDPAREEAMIRAIQEAYYLQARNPSDDATLIELAAEIGLNAAQLAKDLNAPATHTTLAMQIDQARRLGAHGFPSLIVDHDGELRLLRIDYREPRAILEQLTEQDTIAPALQTAGMAERQV